MIIDVPTAAGGTSYALWDYISEMNAAVLWTTNDDASAFVTGQELAVDGGQITRDLEIELRACLGETNLPAPLLPVNGIAT